MKALTSGSRIANGISWPSQCGGAAVRWRERGRPDRGRGGRAGLVQKGRQVVQAGEQSAHRLDSRRRLSGEHNLWRGMRAARAGRPQLLAFAAVPLNSSGANSVR